MTNKQYTLSDLKIGMIVNTAQLHSIYDTYILIANQHRDTNGFNTGEIVYIGNKQTKEMKDILEECTKKYNKKPMIYAMRNLENGIFEL